MMWIPRPSKVDKKLHIRDYLLPWDSTQYIGDYSLYTLYSCLSYQDFVKSVLKDLFRCDLCFLTITTVWIWFGHVLWKSKPHDVLLSFRGSHDDRLEKSDSCSIIVKAMYRSLGRWDPRHVFVFMNIFGLSEWSLDKQINNNHAACSFQTRSLIELYSSSQGDGG